MTAQNRDLVPSRGVPDAGGLSSDAVTMRDPSRSKIADSMSRSWPRRITMVSAVAAFQIRAVWSPAAVTMRDPSGLKTAKFTEEL
jgi:hypothetical protein